MVVGESVTICEGKQRGENVSDSWRVESNGNTVSRWIVYTETVINSGLRAQYFDKTLNQKQDLDMNKNRIEFCVVTSLTWIELAVTSREWVPYVCDFCLDSWFAVN